MGSDEDRKTLLSPSSEETPISTQRAHQLRCAFAYARWLAFMSDDLPLQFALDETARLGAHAG